MKNVSILLSQDENCDTIYYYKHIYNHSFEHTSNDVYIGLLLYHKRSADCRKGMCFDAKLFPSFRTIRKTGRVGLTNLCETMFTVELNSIPSCKRDDVFMNFMLQWDLISSL